MTHRNIWTNAAQFGWHLGVSDRDVYLHTLPMFHCNGWGMPYAITGMGARHIVLRKIDGAEILRRVEAHGVTLLCGAPAVCAAILDAAATWDGPIPGAGTVRIAVAGAPPPTRTIERIEADLGWEFIQVYGLTETSPILTMARRREEWDDLSPAERAQKLGPGRGSGARRPAGTSDEAEVTARANVVFEGYWNQPEETAKAIRDGWFYTGDGGRIDDDHYLHIEDRKKDVIITGGENVSSIEVEDVLFSHPAVAEVAVIGVPDEKWGETVRALVVLAPGAEADAGRAHRPLPDAAGPLQVPDVDRVPHRAGPHRHRQAPEVQAARRPSGRAAPARSTSGSSTRLAPATTNAPSRAAASHRGARRHGSDDRAGWPGARPTASTGRGRRRPARRPG